MTDIALAEHVANKTAERVRSDFTQDLELLAATLRKQWREDLGHLRDDLTAKGLLSEVAASGGNVNIPSVKNVRVLVVDDYPEIRRVFAKMLATAGMVALEAADGVNAAKMLAEDANIEVVVADISMPKNGYTLLEHVHLHHPMIEVVMTSGYDIEPEKIRQLGAFGFLPKPFNMTQAVLIVERAAEARRLKLAAAAVATVPPSVPNP